MARRRTIGDNPLDAISQPEAPPSREEPPSRAKASSERRTETAKTPPVYRPDPETRTRETSAKGGSFDFVAQLFRRNRIRVVGGDVAPCDTKLTPSFPGEARGFWLSNREFIQLKRDVVRIVEQSVEEDRNIKALFGWAAAGAFLAGPIGALAGGLYGGRAHRVALVELRLMDGRKILLATSPLIAAEMKAELGEDLAPA